MNNARVALICQLNDALPQTQCTRCGYPDCMGYAQAIANHEAAINQCSPGGAEGIARLAALTGQAPLPLNPAHGVETPRVGVWIDEAWCIGCTLCIKACPVDAIVGSNKQMHTVLGMSARVASCVCRFARWTASTPSPLFMAMARKQP